MNKNVIVIAPHPDDETLGCGGTLLRHCQEGDFIHWAVVTGMHAAAGFTAERIAAREREITRVAGRYGFHSVHCLDFPTTGLDTIPVGTMVTALKELFLKVVPEVVYAPYPGDVHTDHRITFDATASCSKWFRQSSIKRVLAYETLSETEFCIDPERPGFRPNVFIDISGYLEQKLEILTLYDGEIGEFPFPRSFEAVKALAALRGATAGCKAAEAFMLLKEVI
jgi:LmbE family N-acetylglucosaminyl deacetylase